MNTCLSSKLQLHPFRKRVPSLFQKATLERWKRQLNMYQFMIFNVCCSMIGSTLEHILSIWRLIFHVIKSVIYKVGTVTRYKWSYNPQK